MYANTRTLNIYNTVLLLAGLQIIDLFVYFIQYIIISLSVIDIFEVFLMMYHVPT